MQNPESPNLAATEPIQTEHLTPAQIDARHARHLLERALEQLERGERSAASLSCKQALHLAPRAPLAHSVAGLFFLLESNWKAASEEYEKAVENFGEGSVERARLVTLRGAQASRSVPDVETVLPNLHGEVVRLRAALQAAPLEAFLHDGTAPKTESKNDGAGASTPSVMFAAPPNADSSGALESASLAAAPRLLGRKSTPVAVALLAALVAGLLSFLIVRALKNNDATSVSAPTGNAAPVDNAVTPDASGNPATAAPPASGAPDANPSAPDATNNATNSVAPPSTPASPAQPATPNAPNTSPPSVAPPAVSRPAPARPTISRPTLPVPAPSTPRATPTPRAEVTPTPDPNFPAMPPPRVTLPGAGGPKPEYRRVLPPG